METAPHRMDPEHIRTLYPHPVRLVNAADQYIQQHRYCVGGAICTFLDLLGSVNGFPNTGQLTRALRVWNRALPYRTARYYAECIIRKNDAGLFEDAWRYAERAYTYTPKEA